MKRVLNPMLKVILASVVLSAGVMLGYPQLGRSQGEPTSAEILQITDEPLTITGELSAESYTSEGRYYNAHLFSGEAGQSIIIELSSTEFDTYLFLVDPNEELIASNDDVSAGNTNSQIMVTLAETGTYTIVATSYDVGETGFYSVRIQTATAEAVNQANVLAEAEQLNQQVIQLYQAGRYAEAIPLAERALEIRETVLGETHPDVATSLNNLAELYRAQGNYAAAEPLYVRSLSIRETALGENHPDVATSLNNLALLYQAQGNYAAAEPLYLQSLNIWETALGENHPDVANSLNNLALLYQDQGNYAAAEPLFLRSLNIWETALGENHPNVATSLNNLAELYRVQGNYAAAEPLFLRSLNIWETAFGENHPDVATSLNNLAGLYQAQGNYAAAEPLYLRSLNILETALGENHPLVANSLNNLAELYRVQGNYAAAEPLYVRSLNILETAFGENHPLVAASLNNLAELYRVQGNYAAAEPLYRRSLSIRETAFGENHPDVATSLNNLAELYRVQGNYAAAEPLYTRSLNIYETALGENHPDVASSLNNLASLYQAQGNYAAAEPLFLRSLNIRETALGENHPNVATSLNNLAVLYQAQGNYAAAEPLFLRSLNIWETAFGENHPDVATSLNNLAGLYQAQGNYATAEPLYLRSLNIWETAFGENHPLVANSLNNLAGLYQAQGNYAAPEPLYVRSLNILETALGENHPLVANSLNNLAGLYQAQGNYAAAEPLYVRSLNILETAFGENHPDVATSLNNLAGLYQAQGNYATAEPLYVRSLNILETAFGETHPDVANSLNNLAELYRVQGNYAAAEPLYRRSLNIWETALGENHPLVANSLNNLALLYQAQGNYAAAEPLFLRSLNIRETALGENHPDVATSLNNLAGLSWASNQFSTAADFFQQRLIVEETNLDLILSTGSETRKQAYIATLWGTTQLPISFNLQATPNDPTTTHLALETILRRKGRVLDAVTDNLQLLRQNLDPDSKQLLDDLQSTRSQLVALRFRGLGDQTPEDYQAELTRLEAQDEALSNTLAQRSAEFRVESAPVTIASVQAQIPTDAVLVEFFRYQPFNPTAPQSEQWGDPRYAAYILHPDGTTHGIDLGDAASIDQAIRAYLTQLQRPTSLNAARTAGRTLDDLILEPLRPHIGTAQHLLISPDGQLNLIPFAALVDENDQYLVETHTLTTLTSGRDLLKLDLERPSQQEPVILANPDFDTTLIAQSRGSDPSRSADLTTLAFGELPGTQAEAEALMPLLPHATLLTQAKATEASLYQLNGPSILHLATHGFFLEDIAPIVPPDPTRAGIIPLWDESRPPTDRPLSSENPLLRSGLALAGFNPPRSVEGNNDGVLSALEVTSLNLYGTQLVVLSACETGVGDVVNGEGVYGLRRAFVMAGAESLLMSLWKVPDQETSEWMRLYYEQIINQNQGRSEALRHVQLKLLNSTDYTHPYYWAAFILSGDWRELQTPL